MLPQNWTFPRRGRRLLCLYFGPTDIEKFSGFCSISQNLECALTYKCIIKKMSGDKKALKTLISDHDRVIANDPIVVYEVPRKIKVQTLIRS